MSKQIEEVMELVEKYGDECEDNGHGAGIATYQAIKAKLRELMPGWRPIESAPRYGRILVKCPEIGRCVASAGWDNDTPEVIRWEVINDIAVNPTHWMPLPKATE